MNVNKDLYEQVKNSFTQEQLDDMKELGKHMYEHIDFNTNNILTNDNLAESAAYIIHALKSGLLPSNLTENEIQVMESWGGKDWYSKIIN